MKHEFLVKVWESVGSLGIKIGDIATLQIVPIIDQGLYRSQHSVAVQMNAYIARTRFIKDFRL